MKLIFFVPVKNEEKKKSTNKMVFYINGALITHKLNIETPYNLPAN